MSTNHFTDYCKVLGVDVDATDDAIDRAYRRQIKLLHPDKHGGASDAVERTKLLNEARDTLKDPVRRAAYLSRRRFYQAMARVARNKQTSAPRPTPNVQHRAATETGWGYQPPPVAWVPPPPPPTIPPAVPAGAGWAEFFGFCTLLVGGAYLLSNKNGYDRRVGRYRGRDGTFRSGPFF